MIPAFPAIFTIDAEIPKLTAPIATNKGANLFMNHYLFYNVYQTRAGVTLTLRFPEMLS
ncbi:hypothetical protein IV54_GL001609 [Levilactobacillus paucivorans]|uniref:Uncharacterized protein n=1 Tax=Levilactobacillus paucivorans TaxID=616990 RepID=A0A0R2LW41_9LACO|nr:hypothetical protein IV54_GL001609 [Levilactobacillus paucivorans]